MKKIIALLFFVAATTAQAAPAAGPLRVSMANPRYFSDPSGKAVYLTGSHTWNTLQYIAPGDPPAEFDFTARLDFLERHPVGMTSDGFGGEEDTERLFKSPADWISPSPDRDDYRPRRK